MSARRCSRCAGRGYLVRWSGQDLWGRKARSRKCPECDGTGRAGETSGLVCESCDGEGIDECGSCRGSGMGYTERSHCLSCRGRGVQTCRSCRGSGLTEGDQDERWTA